MPFTKPYTYTTNNILTATGQNSNDVAAQDYINQEIEVADYDSYTFNYDDIQRGELEPITNHHQFTTGEIYGIANLTELTDRSYFTSHIKPTIEVSNNFVIYMPVYESGPCIELEADASILITFGGEVISGDNDTAANGFWDSKIILRVYNNSTYQYTDYEHTTAYTFEEVDMTETVSGSKNPFGVTGKPSSLGQELDEIKYSVRRWIGFHKIVSLTKGNYSFAVYVNPKVEQGFFAARSFLTEVFYT